MAAPMLLRSLPLLHLRLHVHRHLLAVGLIAPSRRPWCTAAAESTRPDEKLSSADDATALLRVNDSPKFPWWDDPDYRRWKEREEIINDVEPIVSLTKKILHSGRYMDWECLTVEDEKAVVEKLLPYHPDSEDKIGCGLDSIMVGRHPEFRGSRCLFVIRTDGGWIDFSYHECLRGYIREKYPSHAERFIQEHFKRRKIRL